VHDHIPDTELARFATDPDSIPADRRLAIEREAAGCASCRTSLDFFCVITVEELADLDASDPAVEWSVDDPMRAYAERIAAEDREADELLAAEKLLVSPTKTAWKDLQRKRRFHTGGVVRRLNAHANTIFESNPLDALTFADAAISVAEVLPDDAYPWSAVFELRGTAWKERANALLVLGEFPAALDALTHAERSYTHLESAGLGLSTVALIRASILYAQGRLDEAAVSAQVAEHGFAHLAQEERRMRAVFLRASINYEAGDIATAISVFRHVHEHGETIGSPRWIARASYAIGNCEVDRRNLADASMHFHKALMIFRDIGPEPDRVATEWGLARVVLHGGQPGEAIRRLRAVADEFERRSLMTDAALVRLDITDALLALGRTKEIIDLATRSFRIFKTVGMITGALTAIAYIKEAAAAGSLTPRGVNAVRSYLKRADRQPNLAFAPPPDSFH